MKSRTTFISLVVFIIFQNRTPTRRQRKTVIRLHMMDELLSMLLLLLFDVVLFCLSCCKNSGVISLVRLYIQSMILNIWKVYSFYKILKVIMSFYISSINDVIWMYTQSCNRMFYIALSHFHRWWDINVYTKPAFDALLGYHAFTRCNKMAQNSIISF